MNPRLSGFAVWWTLREKGAAALSREALARAAWQAGAADEAQAHPTSELGGPTEERRSQGAARFTDADLRAYQQSHGRA